MLWAQSTAEDYIRAEFKGHCPDQKTKTTDRQKDGLTHGHSDSNIPPPTPNFITGVGGGVSIASYHPGFHFEWWHFHHALWCSTQCRLFSWADEVIVLMLETPCASFPGWRSGKLAGRQCRCWEGGFVQGGSANWSHISVTSEKGEVLIFKDNLVYQTL